MRGLENKSSAKGFSLIEVAIVLMIVGLALGGLLGAIGQSTENTRRLEAKNKLREIEESLYAFAQVQGRLPCPARHDSDGLESPVGNSVCTETHGFLPNTTLNLSGSINSDRLLLDPWGNPYRYSVATRTYMGNMVFTNSIGLAEFYNNDSTSLDSTNMLEVCSSSTCPSSDILSNMVPAIVFSMGNNWANYSSNNEIANGGNGSTPLGNYNVTDTTRFVSTEYNEDTFDDMVVWLSPYVLFSKMIAAGKLP